MSEKSIPVGLDVKKSSLNTVSGLTGAKSRQTVGDVTALEFLRQRQRPLERGANPQASGSFSLAELHRRSAQPLRFVELLSDHLQRVRRRIECASDAETGRIVIRVIDRASHEVVREIPFEEALACLGPVFKRGRIDWSRLT